MRFGVLSVYLPLYIWFAIAAVVVVFFDTLVNVFVVVVLVTVVVVVVELGRTVFLVAGPPETRPVLPGWWSPTTRGDTRCVAAPSAGAASRAGWRRPFPGCLPGRRSWPSSAPCPLITHTFSLYAAITADLGAIDPGIEGISLFHDIVAGSYIIIPVLLPIII